MPSCLEVGTYPCKVEEKKYILAIPQKAHGVDVSYVVTSGRQQGVGAYQSPVCQVLLLPGIGLTEPDLGGFVFLHNARASTLKMPLQQPMLPLALEDRGEAALAVGVTI